MILRLLRGNPRRRAIEALHERIVTASREPGLYEALGVPDTVEGRFESLCLHAILVLRRLRGLPAPASDIAQDLTDQVFRHLDASLREMGVGDMGVPKRIKALAQAFYGRAHAYDAALAAPDDLALAETLGRNVQGVAEPAYGLAGYVRAADAALARRDVDALFRLGPGFPAPRTSLREAWS